MNKINIEINNAKLLSYQVDLNDDMPEISATIGLYSGEKQISTFSLRTQKYYGNSLQFEIPFELIIPIKEIAQQLENILTRECNKQLCQLPAPKE